MAPLEPQREGIAANVIDIILVIKFKFRAFCGMIFSHESTKIGKQEIKSFSFSCLRSFVLWWLIF
jgi:hypothetical protein